MNCTEIETLVNAYVDGELDAGHVSELQEHLQDCSTCDQAYRACKGVHEQLQANKLAYTAPLGLRKRVQSALPQDQAKPRPTSKRWNWPALAASLLLGAFTSGAAMEFMPRSSAQTLTDELLASHVRSQMLETHEVDVRSSDQHTVKPWFQGKLDFSPTVHDLADHGYILLGGRLDYLDHRPVAVLVYQRRRHVIDLFIWPVSARDASSQTLARQGYHVIHWTQSNMEYWAVSDLNSEELGAFATLVKERLE